MSSVSSLSKDASICTTRIAKPVGAASEKKLELGVEPPCMPGSEQRHQKRRKALKHSSAQKCTTSRNNIGLARRALDITFLRERRRRALVLLIRPFHLRANTLSGGHPLTPGCVALISTLI